jgi:uncharacterized membrane protein
MNKPWKIVLVLLGIFVAGGVTGAFVMIRVGHRMIANRPPPEQWERNHLKRLAERLDLKPEQLEQIRPIVRRNMEELTRLRATSLAETKTIFERMEQEISAQLTPEQRVKFDQLNKEMHERAKKFLPERRPHPEGPGGPRSEREPPPPSGEPGKLGSEPPPPPPADKPSGQ